MSKNIPCNVSILFSTISLALRGGFTFNNLISYISESRTKPIRIDKDASMPIGVTGVCLALADCDLIWTRADLDPLRARFTKLHELAHLVLGHVPCTVLGDVTPTYAEFYQCYGNIRFGGGIKRVPNSYSDEDEYDAEVLATLFFARLSQALPIPKTNETQLLLYLREKMLAIAPAAFLPTSLTHPRIELEIGDAREFLLSNIDPCVFAAAPREKLVHTPTSRHAIIAYNEAYYIHTLLSHHRNIYTVGTNIPITPITHVRRYNIAVACYLALLEQNRLLSKSAEQLLEML